MENGGRKFWQRRRGQKLIPASVDIVCVFSTPRWRRGASPFMEAWLVCNVHCSTPWISRWVTFWNTPTWRTPCCWAVHEQRTLLTPPSQELNGCLPENTCKSSSKRKHFFFKYEDRLPTFASKYVIFVNIIKAGVAMYC